MSCDTPDPFSGPYDRPQLLIVVPIGPTPLVVSVSMLNSGAEMLAGRSQVRTFSMIVWCPDRILMMPPSGRSIVMSSNRLAWNMPFNAVHWMTNWYWLASGPLLLPTIERQVLALNRSEPEN